MVGETNKLQEGLKSHYKRVGEGFRKHLKGQNPAFFIITCSDSRVNPIDLFDFQPQGDAFVVKNIGSMFSEDAIPSLLYGLSHLHPRAVILLNHTNCGAYNSIFEEEEHIECEIRDYMQRNYALDARKNVEEYLLEKHIRVDFATLSRLVIEEGARIQLKKMECFLEEEYPHIWKRVRDGQVLFLNYIFDMETDGVYVVPEKLTGSEKPERDWIGKYE